MNNLNVEEELAKMKSGVSYPLLDDYVSSFLKIFAQHILDPDDMNFEKLTEQICLCIIGIIRDTENSMEDVVNSKDSSFLADILDV